MSDVDQRSTRDATVRRRSGDAAPHTDQGLERKQQLLDAAETLFASGGYGPTRIADICETAGVAKGLFYWYFETKEIALRRARALGPPAAPPGPGGGDGRRRRSRDPPAPGHRGLGALHGRARPVLRPPRGRAPRPAGRRRAAGERRRLRPGRGAAWCEKPRPPDWSPTSTIPTLLAIGVLGAVAQFSHYHRTGRLKLLDRRAGDVRRPVDDPGAGRGPQPGSQLHRALNLDFPVPRRGRDVPCSEHISPQEDALNSSGPARRGWYRVPGEPGRLRWWDGARWTEDEFVLPGSEAESVDHHPTRRARPDRRAGTPGTAPDRVRAARRPRRPAARHFGARRAGADRGAAARVAGGAGRLLARRASRGARCPTGPSRSATWRRASSCSSGPCSGSS